MKVRKTITRKQLRAVAEFVIDGTELTPEQIQGLRDVADTAPRVYGNSPSWFGRTEAGEPVGCLVGWYMRGIPVSGDTELGRAGVDYLTGLREHLKWPAEVLEVRD